MRNSIFLFFVFGSAFIFMGCQTTEGITISETSLALKQTRISVTAAIGEPRVISQNGREISSQFHDRKLKYLEITPKTKERLYTKVVVLGARRPYDITIEERIEQRDPDSNNFSDVGLDQALTRVQARAIQQALHQSRDKPQTIDDGAPF